eukprot:g7111.t1
MAVPAPAAGVAAAAPLFNLDIDIGSGRSGRIVVRAGADTAQLARAFVAEHSLPAAAAAQLTTQLEQSIAMHHQSSTQRQFR